MKRSIALIRNFSFVLIGLMFACNSPQNESAGNFFQWTDSYGREVKLSHEPQRVISLSPSITEMIFLLQAEDKLVGISDYCQYPPETNKIKRVGGLQNINIESLLALQPDAVLIGSIVPKKEVEMMEKMGINVIAIKEETKIEGLFSALKILGDITNRKQLAQDKTVEFRQKLTTIIIENLPEDQRKKVYYVIGFGDAGDFTAPGNSHIHEIITMAGGHNVGSKLTTWNISREYLFETDPDIIIIRKEDYNQFMKTYPYTLLNAVKQNHVYPIESGWIDIVSPRNIWAVKYLNDKILR